MRAETNLQISYLKDHERNGLCALYKKNGELYYVGRASYLLGRLSTHTSDLHGKEWDKLAIYIIDEKLTLHEVESLLIAVSKPEGNANLGKYWQKFSEDLIGLKKLRVFSLVGLILPLGRIAPAGSLVRAGGAGVINVKTTARNGKVTGISQVSEKSEVMLISQYGKIIRIESKTIRESGRSAQGVRLLNMEPGDRVAAAVVIPPDEEPNGGTLIQ